MAGWRWLAVSLTLLLLGLPQHLAASKFVANPSARLSQKHRSFVDRMWESNLAMSESLIRAGYKHELEVGCACIRQHHAAKPRPKATCQQPYSFSHCNCCAGWELQQLQWLQLGIASSLRKHQHARPQTSHVPRHSFDTRCSSILIWSAGPAAISLAACLSAAAAAANQWAS
jgi:hypothetical protein